MIYFVVIELLDATADDYIRLDNLMTMAGFSRTARSKGGNEHALPQGVYQCRSSRHASELLTIARSVADSTGAKNDLLVIPTTGARWFHNVDVPEQNVEREEKLESSR